MGIQTFKINLSPQEVTQLQTLIRKGTANARTITRARSLLMSNSGATDKEIYEPLDLSVSTPYDIRKRYHTGGMNRALYDAPRPGQQRKLTAEQEAQVIAIACTKAPKGYARWTISLLTEQVCHTLHVSIGRSAIWHVLLRSHTQPWREKNVVYTQNYT